MMTRPSLLRRLVLPGIVLVVTILSALVVFAGGSSPTTSSSSSVLISSTVATANRQQQNYVAPPAAYQTGSPNSGAANSSKRVFVNGHLVAYGNKYIKYVAPPAALKSFGEALYMQNCASCHGVEANGVAANGSPDNYPNLRGLGAATIDFWIETGRMPAADPTSVQAPSRIAKLTHGQAIAITSWVNSLAPATPFIPIVNTKTSNVSNGFSLFALNCAACHTITGGGDELAKGTYAPTLRLVQPTQIAEAIRTGPGNMPRFTGNLSDKQVHDIVGYVSNYIEHPRNVGGIGFGGLGPVAEGFITLGIAAVLLLLIAFWIGERT